MAGGLARLIGDPGFSYPDGRIWTMFFSTKAEYGVRLLVELGRHPDEGPVSLSAIADAEHLPLGYLEQLAPRLRRAGLVVSSRGAHGGYRLARDPQTISMDEVVLALEGAVAPMECFVEGDDAGWTPGRVMCSHEADHGRACATKLLWTRVQGDVFKALARTTLAELIAFSERGSPPLTPLPVTPSAVSRPTVA
jgi:Rrf2 family transcriptional regulator, cysteine metabolism repressor